MKQPNGVPIRRNQRVQAKKIHVQSAKKNIMTRTESTKQPESVTYLKIHLMLHIKN